MPLHVLGISGSLRRDSYNRRALQVAKRFAAEAGAEVSEADLKELALPIYDGDLEAILGLVDKDEDKEEEADEPAEDEDDKPAAKGDEEDEDKPAKPAKPAKSAAKKKPADEDEDDDD